MNAADQNRRDGIAASLRRVKALVVKESRQVIRDPSSIAIGIVLPVVLILLFGFGLSLDVKNVPIAIVLEDSSPDAAALAAGFRLSPYFDAKLVASMPQGRDMLDRQEVDGIVRIRPDFARQLSRGAAPVEVLVNGADANKARIIQAYAQGAIAQWAARQTAEGRSEPGGPVIVQNQLWFNEADDSHYFLVP